jgi:hypothetical protein
MHHVTAAARDHELDRDLLDALAARLLEAEHAVSGAAKHTTQR